MSMALALEFVSEWFRDRNGWTVEQCGVQFQGNPPVQTTSPFYVAIDDAGVETGNESTDSLKERLSIVVGIWRRPEHLHKSIRGNLKLPTDKYLIGAWTLNELERAVLIHKTASGLTTEDKNGLHGNWAFVAALNTRYNLPDASLGAEFRYPFVYRGRGQMETVGTDGGTDIQTWYGYKLRFSGLSREQRMRDATYAIG